MYTTLNEILNNIHRGVDFSKLLLHWGKKAFDDAPLPISTVLACSGVHDAPRCMGTMSHRAVQAFLVARARPVKHRLDDPRSPQAVAAAERFGQAAATAQELNAARQPRFMRIGW